MKVLCYATKLAAGLSTDENLSKKFGIFSKKISGARATLRLIDDIPMLRYTLEFGLGKQVKRIENKDDKMQKKKKSRIIELRNLTEQCRQWVCLPISLITFTIRWRKSVGLWNIKCLM